MMKPLKIKSLAMAALIFSVACNPENPVETLSFHELKQEFTDQRFGMFICYNIMSYGAKWGEANYPIEQFNPMDLNCNQWAEAASDAGMKFGLLTTKHHEGFCLWDSEYTDYDVASTPYGKDIVKQYVDAFRSRDMKIGLYYSIWDSTHEIDSGKIDGDKLSFVNGQIRELLSNYGKIDYFVIDGWFWRMGHKEVPFHEIRKLIRELQPDCLISDHTHFHAPYHLDIPYYEGPFGAFPAEGNLMASALGHCSVRGNGWFWSPVTPDGMKKNDGVEVVLDKLIKCESRYCNFLLNCMPNREGLLDTIFLEMLADIGQRWSPDTGRPALPDQGKELVVSVPVKKISASSGDASLLFDGRKVPGGNHTTWISDSSFPQEIIIELEREAEIDVLMLVPDHRVKPAPEEALSEGNIIRAKIYTSLTGDSWEYLTEDLWDPDALYRTIALKGQSLRFVRLEILAANGPVTKISELELGYSSLP